MGNDAKTGRTLADVFFPLSGDVTQSINPWEMFIRSLSSQMGVINIHNLNTGDAATEQKIVENVAGYGRQLGHINDVLALLVDRLDQDSLTGRESVAVEEFREMTAQIALVKRGWRSPGDLLAALDRLLDGIDELATESPADYEKAMRRIRQAAGN